MYYVFNQNQETYITNVQASLVNTDFFVTTAHQKLVINVPTTVQTRTYEWTIGSDVFVQLPTYRPVFVVDTTLSLINYEYSNLDNQAIHSYLSIPDIT